MRTSWPVVDMLQWMTANSSNSMSWIHVGANHGMKPGEWNIKGKTSRSHDFPNVWSMTPILSTFPPLFPAALRAARDRSNNRISHSFEAIQNSVTKTTMAKWSQPTEADHSRRPFTTLLISLAAGQKHGKGELVQHCFKRAAQQRHSTILGLN